VGLTWTTLIASAIFVGAGDVPGQEPSARAADSSGAAPLSIEAPPQPAGPPPSALDSGTAALDAQHAEEQSAPRPFGQKDSWRFNIQGAYGNHIVENADSFALGGIGLSYFPVDHLSLEMEFNGLYFDQAGPEAWGGNFNLLMRWHFLWKEKWSLYVDGGAGVLFTTDDVPQEGSSFNFTPQAGLGVSLAISDETRLLAGVRWHHISNANIFSSNPGRDSVEVYAGLSFPF
jgi:lipid A 3-O-deacylase